MTLEQVKLSRSGIATAVLFGAGVAHAEPVETIDKFFYPS